MRRNESGFGCGQEVDLALAWNGRVVGEDEPDGEAGQLVFRERPDGRKQNFVRRLLVVLIVADDLGRQTLDELGIQGDEGGEQDPHLVCAECRWRVLDDAIQRRDARLIQHLFPGAFGLMLLLLPLKLASPFLGLALLFFRELLFELFGILLALGGFLFGLLLGWFGCVLRLLDDGRAWDWLRRGFGGIVDGAIVLGAHADGSSNALAVDDQSSAGEGAGWLGVGVLGGVEDFVLATIKNAGTLFVSVAP